MRKRMCFACRGKLLAVMCSAAAPHTDGCLEMHAGDSMHEHDRAEEWDQKKN